jgi:dephospho-CoA kinase
VRVVGLTGSLAMGKTQTARFFAEEGVPVFDADAAVHQLYAKGGRAVGPVAAIVPDALVKGGIDRERLAAALEKDATVLPRLEAAVHPLVREQEGAFIAEQQSRGAPVVVLDIPLLFESGRAGEFDAVIVVTASPETQRHRALARPGMTVEKLNRILARQMPDDQKRAAADFIIDTDHGFDRARSRVKEIVDKLR